MPKLTDAVLTAIKKTVPACVATASADGIPNIVYVTFIKAVDGDSLVVADNKFDKTRSNLDANPRMSVVVLDPEAKKAYQMKCRAECVTQGDRYDRVVDWVREKRPEMTPKAAFYLSVDEVYCGAERLA